MFEDVNLVALIVAVLGAGGVGAFFREIVSVIAKVREGVSAKESTRKTDLVAQRDQALAREADAEARADSEATKRRKTQEYASRLRRAWIEQGLTPPDWPDIEDTTPAARLAELREKPSPQEEP